MHYNNTTTTNNNKKSSEMNEILNELLTKQKMLVSLESSFHPKLRQLLSKTIEERKAFESPKAVKERESQRKLLADYEAVLERHREIDREWQKQLERDMEAVCEICQDGEVTPENQILFCEACNVAVHQYCYGIEEVPEGDYYCLACRYFGREKTTEAIGRKVQRGGSNASTVPPRMAPSPLPICCELCPRKQGAFIRTDTPSSSSLSTREEGRSKLNSKSKIFKKSKKSSNDESPNSKNKSVSRWVHVICAKWQGLGFIPNSKEVIEDVTELKENFRHVLPRVSCMLCLGNRGAFNQCPEPGCNKWLHVTCARAAGTCKVVHGENCHGPVETDGWTLWCPEHSNIPPEEVPEGSTPIDQLIRAAEEFPPEPEIPPPKPRPPKFIKMTGKERRQWLDDPEYEADFLELLRREKFYGVKCEVCNQLGDDSGMMTRCVGCDVVFCDACKYDCDGAVKGKDYLCAACKYVQEKEEKNEEFSRPQCHMCFQPGGWMRGGFAKPVNKKGHWSKNPKEYAKSLFAKDLWCHAVCTLWQSPDLAVDQETGKVDCSNVIMSNGKSHIRGQSKCALCGLNGGLKLKCCEAGCRAHGELCAPFYFHPTCARQAGLEVDTMTDEGNEYYTFYTKCFVHSGCDFAFRAKLEDLLEIAKKRYGKRLQHLEKLTMSIADASRLLNASILVMASLGWAWRWAEWWVEYGDNWEPFLEPHEDESKMTKEQLRIVDSTRESRAEDARKCRLTALGAALRNRNYDDEEGDAYGTLDGALRSMLHAQSLVGPLEDFEIDFFAEWLGRAYRSRSRLLGYTDDKIRVSERGRCVHIEDKSPKYELGNRPLPGKQDVPEGEVFEKGITEIDDFLKPETMEDGTIITKELLEENLRSHRKKAEKKRGKSPLKKAGKRSSRKPKAPPETEEQMAEDRAFEEDDEDPIPKKRSVGGDKGTSRARKHHIIGDDDDDDDDYIDGAESKSRKRVNKKSDGTMSPSPKRRGRPPGRPKKAIKKGETLKKRKHSAQRSKPRRSRLSEEGDSYQDTLATSEISTDIPSVDNSVSEYVPIPRKRRRPNQNYLTFEMGSAVKTLSAAAADTRALGDKTSTTPIAKKRGWPKGRPRKQRTPGSTSLVSPSAASEEKSAISANSKEIIKGSSNGSIESSSAHADKGDEKEEAVHSEVLREAFNEEHDANLSSRKQLQPKGPRGEDGVLDKSVDKDDDIRKTSQPRK
mmetsp:Transcript_3140/g.4504  ORF Transcript_3140/g.4504 Transcript_3140/m.4504 type:complete len:1211 (+) Transcript_3140:297-3929(+)